MTRSSGRRSPVIATLLVLAACGGVEEATHGGQTAPTSASPTGPIVKIVIPQLPGRGEALVTVEPTPARNMTIADVLRRDERFTVFRQLAEHTRTGAPGFPSWLELWDWPASRLGDDREGLTVFVPTDEAFGGLEAVVREVLAQGELIDAERYWLLGFHEVHRLFPSSEFSAGSVGSWEGDVEMTVDPLTYGGQPILQTDLRVANGYIHVIGGVVVPPLVLKAANS